MPKAYLSIVLLLTNDTSPFGLPHKHDLRLLGCDEHQHLRGEIATTKRVLPIEGERVEVWHIGVKQHKRDIAIM